MELILFLITCYNSVVSLSGGCGGIGRRTRFRFWRATVGVRVPSPAPQERSKSMCSVFLHSLRMMHESDMLL